MQGRIQGMKEKVCAEYKAYVKRCQKKKKSGLDKRVEKKMDVNLANT